VLLPRAKPSAFLVFYFDRSPKPEAQKEKGKKPRVWDLGNSNAKVLDYSNSATNGSAEAAPVEEFDPDTVRKSQVAASAFASCSGVHLGVVNPPLRRCWKQGPQSCCLGGLSPLSSHGRELTITRSGQREGTVSGSRFFGMRLIPPRRPWGIAIGSPAASTTWSTRATMKPKRRRLFRTLPSPGRDSCSAHA